MRQLSCVLPFLFVLMHATPCHHSRTCHHSPTIGCALPCHIAGTGAVKLRESGKPTLKAGLKINPHTGLPIPGGGRPQMGPGWS